MRLFLVLVLALALGAVAYFLAGTDTQSVAFSGFGYSVKMPFLLFLPGLIITILALYLLASYLLALFRAPRKISQWNGERCADIAQAHTMKGFAGLIEGNWQQAEDDLLTKLPHNKSALINYLGLAYSAQQRGMHTRRDLYIKEALNRYPKQQNAIDLTHARLQFQAGEHDKAQAKLEKLVEGAPKNKAALRLLADVYEKTENYDALLQVLPKAKKLDAIPADQLAHKEHVAYQNVLANPALSVDESGAVDDAWNSLPRQAKKNANAIYAHAQALIAEGKVGEAEKIVRKSLNSQYDAQLAEFYGQIDTKFTKDQLKLVDSWLKKNPQSDELRLSKARLHRRVDDIDAAQQTLQQLIADNSYLRTQACTELGELLEQIGEKDAALLCYKNGLIDNVENGIAKLEHTPNESQDDAASNDAIIVPVLENMEHEDRHTQNDKKTD